MSRVADIVINDCIVGRTKLTRKIGGFAWLCRKCGVGGINGLKMDAEKKAQGHVCESPV